MGSSVTESMSSDVLDLTNFDTCGHLSPFVLTSPRSLLACRKAKIKPNELLYKSAADISKDLDVSIKLAYPVYQQHEKIRQEKLEACRQERNKLLHCETITGSTSTRKKRKKCLRKEMSFYRNNIASNMRRTKSIQNKLNEDEKNVYHNVTKRRKRRCKKSKSISDLMDLKELCKEVDRIAILERREPNMMTDKRKTVKKRSRSGNATRLMDISGIHIPDQDRKILDSMRRKREERQYGEDLAHRVNIFWEQMREEEKRLTKEQKQKWQDFITAKRNVENGVKHMRLDELRMAFENNQRQLEEHMIQKDIKVNELKQQIEDRKLFENALKQDTEFRKHKIASDNNFYEQMNTLQHKKRLHDINLLKQKKADEIRNKSLQISQERIMSSNRMEELRHAVQLERIQARHDDTIRRKFDECQAKERKAFQNHLDKMSMRMRELANKSLQREQHMGQVHRVARELEDGMQRWQDRIMLMQYEQLRRAKENAALYTDNKKLRTEIENKRRILEHSAKIQRVKEAERARLCNIKKEIEEEEKKIRRIKQKKDLEIQMGRKLALSTAELRKEIRRSTELDLFTQR
ncbi:golgin subfamily A member 6-like protein 22 isoform X2 [Myzus persicae]|uniref:golgin subfamily A member 6-like protein 22 isoform X2 n=1 Tax=Myzus persicae TaxID=13164 RepID=UPI000B93231A|nr:golgin subfamily A member 6-like protein 22 isoform X2 [Myzus persicae]